jgi:phospholipase/lecithinase/hemolysin
MVAEANQYGDSRMQPTRRIAATIAGLCLALSPVAAHAYSALYVFGDSLSDAGNDFIATSGAEPAAPYVNGEFSNGPIWAQDLSQSLGLGTLAPSLAGGTDYAFGGATTGLAATATPGSIVPTLTAQIGLFAAAHGSVAPSTALYSVWIGSNDLLNIIASGTSGLTALSLAQQAAQSEATDIAGLAGIGARDFLVPLVSDLGAAPELTSQGLAASTAGTALALAYDAALEADLANLAATPGIDLSFLDTFSLVDAAVADPSAFGLTDATDPCYTGTYFGGGSACADPNQYLFWDALHPTAAVHAVIAEAAFDEVPEPRSLAVLATALAGLVAMTRRRA